MNGTLHLHAQPLPHGDAIVIADEEGLAALKAAVDLALSDERGIGRARPLTADGEVYDLYVVVARPGELDKASLPYTDEDFRERRPGAVHPEKTLWDRVPAHRLQLGLMRLRAEALYGAEEDAAKLERRIAKPLGELTSREADAWIDRLNSELDRREEANP